MPDPAAMLLSERPMLSVVLPVYNERETLDALARRLAELLEPLCGGAYDVWWVDDGSTDGSVELLDGFHAADGRMNVIHLSRNFGHQAALQAGLDAATGRAVVLMDADLQDPPEVLTSLVAKWREGYEVVYAIRRNRKEGWPKRMAYSLFYRMMKAMAAIDMPVEAGDFCLLDRRVVDVLISLREQNRFLRGLRSWVGFKQIGIPYDRPARCAGVPKYTLRKLMHLALSGYLGFSVAPLRLASWLGIASASLGFVLILWVLVTKLTHQVTPQGWASTLAVVLFIGGLNLLVLGVIGEYLSRVYDEVRRRPLYLIRSKSASPDQEAVASQDPLAARTPAESTVPSPHGPSIR